MIDSDSSLHGDNELCAHCLMGYGEHADNKCIYESTQFSNARCFECNLLIRAGSKYYCVTIDGVDRFIAQVCLAALIETNWGEYTTADVLWAWNLVSKRG